jgi:hypothetical protein
VRLLYNCFVGQCWNTPGDGQRSKDAWRAYDSLIGPFALVAGGPLLLERHDWNGNMRLEVTFKGTPYMFVSEVETRLRDLAQTTGLFFLQEDETDLGRVYSRGLFPAFAPEIEVARLPFGQQGSRRDALVAIINAQLMPDGNTRLVVTAEDNSWSQLKEWWKLLHTALTQQGWIDTPPPVIAIKESIASAPPIRRRGGRPRNADDDWARTEVREKFRQPEDVFPEWLKRIGDRAETLADPRDSFYKAIRPRRNKGEKTE